MENQLDKINASVSNVNNTLMQATECFNSIDEIGDKIINCANSVMDLQREMHMMDLQFNAYVAKLDSDLEKHKVDLPTLEKQLDKINDRMDRILDKVLEMETNTEKEIDEKNKMMEMLMRNNETITSLIMKLF